MRGRRARRPTSRSPGDGADDLDSSARGCDSPGLDSDTIPLPARIAATDANDAAPVIPGLPATTRTARDHLWASADGVATSAATSAALDDVGPGRRVEADVDDLDVAGEAFAGAEQQARLEGGERHRAAAGEHARPASPVSPSTPLGMSTASTGRPPTRGAVHSPWNPVP